MSHLMILPIWTALFFSLINYMIFALTDSIIAIKLKWVEVDDWLCRGRLKANQKGNNLSEPEVS